MPVYTFVGPKHPSTDFVEEIVFERDDDGNVTKNVVRGGSVEMTVEMFEHLSQNYLFTEGGDPPPEGPVEVPPPSDEEHYANPAF
jgi:hypothetical protein